MTFRRLIGTLAALLLVGGTLTACGKDDGAEKALRGFVSAWESGKLAGRKLADSNGAALSGDTAQAELTKTEGDLAARRPKVTIKGKPTVKETSATATVTVAWPVTDAATWTYDSTVRLVKRKDDWLPVFAPQTIVPKMPRRHQKYALAASTAKRRASCQVATSAASRTRISGAITATSAASGA